MHRARENYFQRPRLDPGRSQLGNLSANGRARLNSALAGADVDASNQATNSSGVFRLRMTIAAVAVLCITSAASADDISDKVCPIIEKIAAESSGKADYAVQSEILFQIVGAYDDDGDKLREIVGQLDASTTAACPDARTTVLTAAAVQSLAQALR